MFARLFITLFFALAATTGARANDSHAGYYYPDPNTSEVYVSSVDPMPDASKRTRIGFTVGLNAQQLKRAYPPQYHIFAKGANAQKLIIVASGHTRYDTLYRLRALLAGLTAEARTSPLFRQAKNPENLNFLDLLRMTGFEQVTVSDGADIAHRITLR
ncbi:MAG: hypothetical protein AAF903_12815 [Pseudomonadota bacterium]